MRTIKSGGDFCWRSLVTDKVGRRHHARQQWHIIANNDIHIHPYTGSQDCILSQRQVSDHSSALRKYQPDFLVANRITSTIRALKSTDQKSRPIFTSLPWLIWNLLFVWHRL